MCMLSVPMARSMLSVPMARSHSSVIIFKFLRIPNMAKLKFSPSSFFGFDFPASNLNSGSFLSLSLVRYTKTL